MGKGDTYRPVNRARYDRNYLRIFGERCPVCGGDGWDNLRVGHPCPACNGLGYVEKTKTSRGCEPPTPPHRITL